jgi:predicted ArsR family transcriptional regulator
MAKTLPHSPTIDPTIDAESLEGRRFDDSGISGGSCGDGCDSVQVSDQAIMAHMRTHAGTSILDLAEKLAVTDTAVRQRLTRLLDRGLVERFAVREGRGRPKHVYRLTEAGVRASGANLDDLAVALWQELVSLEDAELRERLLRRVVSRLASRYAPEVYGTTPDERLKSVVELFNRRGIPFAFERAVAGRDRENKESVGQEPGRQESASAAVQPLGRLVVLGCPYPGLKDDQRLVCRMEQMLFQRLIGVPLEDITPGHGTSGHVGGGCCSFVPLQGQGLAEGALVASGPPLETMGSAIRSVETPGRSQCGKSNCDCH